jgi:hypothetical protein
MIDRSYRGSDLVCDKNLKFDDVTSPDQKSERAAPCRRRKTVLPRNRGLVPLAREFADEKREDNPACYRQRIQDNAAVGLELQDPAAKTPP